MRSGFSLVMAIMFLVLVATLSMFALSLSATTSKHTTDIFLREQAELLAQGATEMAVQNLLGMEIGNVGGTQRCPTANAAARRIVNTNLSRNGTILFNVTVDVVDFIGQINGCGTPITLDGAGNNPSTGTVILDVTVTSNPDFNIPIRFHRRTIQKL
ncbi:hypothetical protein ACPF04_04775 [Campylobacter sp. MOP51]|uniref:hypothetical protein n=1 Tax=Campylobacter canis TaxID=3378588 RepID=UPI003C3C8093